MLFPFGIYSNVRYLFILQGPAFMEMVSQSHVSHANVLHQADELHVVRVDERSNDFINMLWIKVLIGVNEPLV